MILKSKEWFRKSKRQQKWNMEFWKLKGSMKILNHRWKIVDHLSFSHRQTYNQLEITVKCFTKNATVFPVPVLALARTSLPIKTQLIKISHIETWELNKHTNGINRTINKGEIETYNLQSALAVSSCNSTYVTEFQQGQTSDISHGSWKSTKSSLNHRS